jgi:hypothetical protein
MKGKDNPPLNMNLDGVFRISSQYHGCILGRIKDLFSMTT